MNSLFLQTRGAIVNELYFLTAGGTLWLDEAVLKDECKGMLDSLGPSIMESSVCVKAPLMQNQGEDKKERKKKTVCKL